ncbi:hypothetical protein BJX68DRAFT_229354 [Aspergillus pseudodeflectus]|uniref:F-box domain-containing protein n=1 Tax=Aspergillus pseudodeflectus TaxID=176178 RepID=A0ABR4KZM8_9EURO
MHPALSTPELLEQIFLLVDTASLLTSTQRVCHLWHTMITQTPSIQRLLFFRPEISARAQPERTIHAAKLNPFLTVIFPSWFPSASTLTDERGYRTSNLEPELLRRLERDWNGDAHHLIERQDASWRRMLLTQPPVLGVGLVVDTVMWAPFPEIKGWRVAQDGRKWEWMFEKTGYESGNAFEIERREEGMKEELEPISMGVFYDLIMSHTGGAHTWIVVWGNGLPRTYVTRELWRSRHWVKGLVIACGVVVVELAANGRALEESL